jgi:hypothetical protein
VLLQLGDRGASHGFGRPDVTLDHRKRGVPGDGADKVLRAARLAETCRGGVAQMQEPASVRNATRLAYLAMELREIARLVGLAASV